MDIRDVLDRLSLLSCEKISLSKFSEAFSGTVYIAGKSLDNKVLDFISDINLLNVKKIIILTPYSNLDKNFTTSWNGLEKYLSENKVGLELKAPNQQIPSDIFFLDDKSIFFIPRFYFQKKIIECCICKNTNKGKRILNAFASSEDFTHVKGEKIYHLKFNSIFQIDKRYLSEREKEQFLNALVSWESSGDDDIEPVWRIFEEKIREFIKKRLEKDNPTNWFSAKVLTCFNHEPKIKDGILKLFDKNKNRLGKNIDKHHNPNEYLNAENYEYVINKNHEQFKDYRDKLNRKYRDYVSDVIKARNASIHNRTPDDDAELFPNIIIKILMSLEWLNKLEPSLLQ